MNQYSTIKELGALVTQANRLGLQEIKLSKNKAIDLLAEINYLLTQTIESPKVTVNTTGFDGGNFKN
jgi:hypothetical protein